MNWQDALMRLQPLLRKNEFILLLCIALPEFSHTVSQLQYRRISTISKAQPTASHTTIPLRPFACRDSVG